MRLSSYSDDCSNSRLAAFAATIDNSLDIAVEAVRKLSVQLKLSRDAPGVTRSKVTDKLLELPHAVHQKNFERLLRRERDQRYQIMCVCFGHAALNFNCRSLELNSQKPNTLISIS